MRKDIFILVTVHFTVTNCNSALHCYVRWMIYRIISVAMLNREMAAQGLTKRRGGPGAMQALGLAGHSACPRRGVSYGTWPLPLPCRCKGDLLAQAR
jgi:hypothetical protein